MDKKYWSLENIINDVKAQAPTETKSLNGIFIDIVEAMGVASSTLQDRNKRYKFSQKGHDFWMEALKEYTNPPYTYIRSREYEKLPTDIVYKFLNMIVEAIENVGKTSDEIYQTLYKIDSTIEYSINTSRNTCLKLMERYADSYIKAILSHGFLTFVDKEIILYHMEKEILNKYLDKALQDTLFLMDYFNEERLCEAQDSSIDSTDIFANKILEADENADEKIKADALIKQGYSKIAVDEIKNDRKRKETKGRISKKARARDQIERRKVILQNEADREMGISSRQRQGYNLAKRRCSKEILEEALKELNFNNEAQII